MKGQNIMPKLHGDIAKKHFTSLFKNRKRELNDLAP